MATTKKIDAKRVAKYAIVISIIFIIIGLLDMNNPGFTENGRGTLTGLCVALSAALMSCAYFIFAKEGASHRKIGMVMLAISMLTAIGFLGALIAVMVLNSYSLEDMNLISLSLKSVGFALIAWIGMMALVVSVSEFLGKNFMARLEKMVGATRTEKMRLGMKRLLKIWEQYKQSRMGMIALYILTAIVIFALAGPYIAPENPLSLPSTTNPLPTPPDTDNWFGTDAQSKDVWSQFLYGGGTSLLVGFMAGLLSIVIGTAIGLTAGYFGKASDEILMRLTDFFLVIPWFPLMIVLCAILGRSLWIVIFVIGITCWSPTARIVRAAVLSIKEKMYIERSRALGARNMHIIGRHIFPNVFPLIVATSILLVGEAIFSEAFLDFFGLGDPNVVSWGWMLERAHANSAMINLWWWWVLPPAIGIVLLIMSFYLIGDTLDEILNPRLKRR